jgi:hypothetical protein
MVQSVKTIGFKLAQVRLVSALETGAFVNVMRAEPGKNLLAEGQITVPDVVAIVKRARGNNYREEPEDSGEPYNVHMLKDVRVGGMSWYIKWYVEGITVVISVHT